MSGLIPLYNCYILDCRKMEQKARKRPKPDLKLSNGICWHSSKDINFPRKKGTCAKVGRAVGSCRVGRTQAQLGWSCRLGYQKKSVELDGHRCRAR